MPLKRYRALLHSCTICGKLKASPRPVCHACHKSGKSVNSPNCKKCGAITANRQRTLCEDCRAERRSRAGIKFFGRNKMSGPDRDAEMLEAETPLKDDPYAQTAPIISDEEIALKREKFHALLAADVHTGSCGHPTRHHVAEVDREGGFGTLAHQHMRGGEAGRGTDRTHTDRWTKNRGDRGR